MVNVRVQKYIREEKYYIISTEMKNKYIGVTYDSILNAVRIDMFTKNDSNIGGKYLVPRVTTQIILSMDEVEVLQKMMSMLWNQSKNNNTFNKSFNIKNDRIENTYLKLIKTRNKNLLVLNNLVKNSDSLHKSITFTLSRHNCRALYSTIRHITKGV